MNFTVVMWNVLTKTSCNCEWLPTNCLQYIFKLITEVKGQRLSRDNRESMKGIVSLFYSFIEQVLRVAYICDFY